MSSADERYDRRADVATISEAEIQAAANHFVPGRAPLAVRRLAGGFQNANFLVDYGSDRYCLRFVSGGREVAEREARILCLASAGGVRTPEALGVDVVGGRAVALHRFIAGVPLDKVEGKRGLPLRSLGEQLARVHRIRFEREGIFDAQGEVREMAGGGRYFIEHFLGGIAGERMGPARKNAVRELVAAGWPEVDETFGSPALVHCDFNPKNILVAPDGEVAAILDWEFAIAGHSLIDLGNFFRFTDDYSADEREVFLAAYAREGGALPPNWRKVARLLDLVSLCAFLARPEDYPKTFRTALDRIDETLEALA